MSVISPYLQLRLTSLVNSGSKLYREEDNPILRSKYRTECWLEQCIYEERICAAEDHVSFVPLAIDIPISGWRIPLLLGYLFGLYVVVSRRRKDNNVSVRVRPVAGLRA